MQLLAQLQALEATQKHNNDIEIIDVTTIEENDDRAWLLYWLLGGVLFIATEWVDDMLLKGSEYRPPWRADRAYSRPRQMCT